MAEFILSDIFSESMLLNPSDHPVLMVEPAVQNKENRIKATEMLFEKFGFKGIFFQKVKSRRFFYFIFWGISYVFRHQFWLRIYLGIKMLLSLIQGQRIPSVCPFKKAMSIAKL